MVLNSLQQSRVDSAFQELFGYSWGTSFDLPEDSVRAKILADVLGPRKAASLLKLKTATRKTGIVRKRQTYKAPPPGSIDVQQKPAATDEEPSVDSKVHASATSGGVEQLLEQMQGISKQSTVAKTSDDWEQFKDRTGLGDKLEAQATSNTSYLRKKDFLDRVDHRKFELEKKDRDRERSKRGV